MATEDDTGCSPQGLRCLVLLPPTLGVRPWHPRLRLYIPEDLHHLAIIGPSKDLATPSGARDGPAQRSSVTVRTDAPPLPASILFFRSVRASGGVNALETAPLLRHPNPQAGPWPSRRVIYVVALLYIYKEVQGTPVYRGLWYNRRQCDSPYRTR